FVLSAALLSHGCERTAPPVERTAPGASTLPEIQPLDRPKPSQDATIPPDGFVRVRVGGITPAGQGNAVLLVDDEQQRALVVFIGDTEALSIQLRLQGTKYKRPLTHDLLDSMLAHLGAKVHSVRVDRLHDDIFYGVVVLQDGERLEEFDSRTSDGIALALGSDAPVFVAREVLERAGIAMDADGNPRAGSRAEGPERNPIAL